MVNLIYLALIMASLAVTLWLGHRGRGIVIVIPFRAPTNANERVRNLAWLEQYWKTQLPGAEIIIGDDPDTNRPFSKSVAINRAVARSHGDILVLVDADGYLPVESVLHCAREIRHARKRGFKLWFVPYRKFYRLTNEATIELLNSSPRAPYIFPADMSDSIVKGASPAIAHWHGALIQIMPREAFDSVGGWDAGFRGWGGEDHAAMRATDTLYGPHKTLPGPVYHLWHPVLTINQTDNTLSTGRMWENQQSTNVNSALCSRYYKAQGNYKLMRQLVDEAKTGKSSVEYGPSSSTPTLSI